jgi:hypothetical protein
MHGPDKQFLSRARFPGDQHAYGMGRGQTCLPFCFPELLASADNIFKCDFAGFFGIFFCRTPVVLYLIYNIDNSADFSVFVKHMRGVF